MFLGRTSELNYLNAFYDSEGSQLLVVYGQKNIGKTSLLKEFVKGKPYHYYCARSASEREQTYELKFFGRFQGMNPARPL